MKYVRRDDYSPMYLFLKIMFWIYKTFFQLLPPSFIIVTNLKQ